MDIIEIHMKQGTQEFGVCTLVNAHHSTTVMIVFHCQVKVLSAGVLDKLV
jgi:hypothetical protein